MAESKKSFILYCDLIHTIKKMPMEKAGELFLHILKYVNDENPETEDLIINLTFEPIKQQLKRDLNRWSDVKVEKSNAGKLGGIKSGEARRKQKEANEANASNSKQKEANEAVNVNVNVNVTQIENWFTDLRNSNTLIDIARVNNLEVELVKKQLINFRTYAELSYADYNRFVNHFKNWINKQKESFSLEDICPYTPDQMTYFRKLKNSDLGLPVAFDKRFTNLLDKY